MRTTYLAGGCFWGLEELIRDLPGITDTEVGYTGGENDHPDYRNHPGHAEAIEIEYDETLISFSELLDFFFRVHDPSTKNRQGNDVGSSYRSAIFYQTEDERAEAEAFIAKVDASGRWRSPVVTALEPFTIFWSAEAEHQDYLRKHPGGYTCHYVRSEVPYSELGSAGENSPS